MRSPISVDANRSPRLVVLERFGQVIQVVDAGVAELQDDIPITEAEVLAGLAGRHYRDECAGLGLQSQRLGQVGGH